LGCPSFEQGIFGNEQGNFYEVTAIKRVGTSVAGFEIKESKQSNGPPIQLFRLAFFAKAPSTLIDNSFFE
jgi:hypothetical protein